MFRLSCPSTDFPISPLTPPPFSHPLNAASLALDNSLEEDGAENGPILAALEGLRTALEAGAKDPLELNAGARWGWRGRGGYVSECVEGKGPLGLTASALLASHVGTS